MSNTEPHLLNALLRCTRTDEKAAPLFECVDEDLGLWVWELGPKEDTQWSAAIHQILEILHPHAVFLSMLKANCQDYTLHLSLQWKGHKHLYQLPGELIQIAHEAGFAIEFFQLED